MRGALRVARASGERLLAPVPQRRRDNLPAEISSFVGRESAIAQIVELVSDHRLVTLSGAPGVGKTRLALRVAEELRDDHHGDIWLVELAALAEPELIPGLIASTLGLRDQERVPPLELLRQHIGSAPVLLVLDNCEHLTTACATLVDELLRSCPNLRVVATSREALGLIGEVCWTVQPLTLPDQPPAHRESGALTIDHQARIEWVIASEAGRLFVERARAVRPGLSLNGDVADAIAQVCCRLDGIPLAIELAAARVSALTPQEIASRLDDRFRLLARTGRSPLLRQRALRASIDWSYELLSDPERALLRRLAVFRGGWSLEAAEALAGDGFQVPGFGGEASRSAETQHPTAHTQGGTLDLLASLVDKSLVVADARDDETRYAFLETIRAYADERLRDHGEVDALVERHWAWCVALAEEASAYLRTPEQGPWRKRLAQEHDNIRVALARSIERRQAEPGLRLCIALWHFWIDRGDAREGYGWLTRLLALESASERTVMRAAALFVAAKLAYEGGDIPMATALGEESLEIAREVGDPHTTHRMLTQLGHIARGRSDWLAARRFYEEALPLRRALAEPVDVAVSLACLGHVHRALQEYDTARTLYEESLELARQQGHPAEITAAQHDLGRLAHERGHDDEAASWYAEALREAMRINHPRRVAYLLEGFATLAVAPHPEQALQLAGAAAEIRRMSGSQLPPSDQAALDRQLAPARATLSTTRAASAWQAGMALSAEQAMALALSPPWPRSHATDLPPSKPELALPAGDALDSLTAREREVLGLVARGLTNRQIADTLVVSERTAEWHVANTLGKLGLTTRAQLAVWASQRGLVESVE
jgi:predicted ATPase/DNA-binding CsgD family transcriptional regulator